MPPRGHLVPLDYTLALTVLRTCSASHYLLPIWKIWIEDLGLKDAMIKDADSISKDAFSIAGHVWKESWQAGKRLVHLCQSPGRG